MSNASRYDLSSIGGRVGWALGAAKGKSQAGLGKALDRPSSAISNIVTKNRALRPNGRWDEIASYLGVNLPWLMTGKGPVWADPLLNDDIDHQFTRTSLDSDFKRIPLDDDQRAYTESERYSPVIPGAFPELDISAGAGEGIVGDVYSLPTGSASISGHRVVAEWKFPDAFVRHELGLSTAQTIIAPVRGDSMSPTYRDGDRVIIDLRVRDFADDGVYFITDGQSAPRIKRLEYVFNSSPPTVRVISDNPASAEQKVALHELTILGRISGRITRG
ncbi:LexA family transcriptional regulator [Ancylobacter polymorphus]|uniref:LexA family transcriptional regulator n=1 Tax=Ancylobacter polymorphus TaxID=223390 RepID=A0A9E7D608_9HYPH|nr:LexA family transcriptional regulator [Ancylobacter polymorphus]UOK71675.1 LexA family transcriptional regulator [Ancylobacter polymorphus]